MKKQAYVARNILGVFAFDTGGERLAYEAFPRNAEEITRRLRTPIGSTPEGKRLLKQLKGYECILEEAAPGAGEVEKGAKSPEGYLRSNLDGVLGELDYPREEYEGILREVAMLMAKVELREALGEEDRLLMQAIEALDDVDEGLNLLSERMREWYSLHFPELDAEVEDHGKYASLIRDYRSREGFEASEEFGELARRSSGGELGERDISVLSDLAVEIIRIQAFRRSLEGYISSKMEEIAQNLSALAGPLVGAKLISIAGGLEELARMPGSRIQVLGAEKALFRHIKEKGTPPKHGVIFQHPLVKTSPWWQRGKIARSFASKIAIAARVDAFSGKYVGDQLKKDLSRRVEAIRRQAEPKKMRIIRRQPQGRKGKKRKRGRG